ncbi:MAG: radical SAM protein, partial [Armatimonadetes bacterium]|nr:radical SAM protein [Armatimonadota bacterium]
ASVTMNPEPLAALIDAFVIGEAEPIVPAVVGAVVGAQSRSERLRALARLPGLYVPTQPPTTPVRRLVWPGAATHPRTSLVLSPYAAFPDRFLIEVGRGCPMGCRFCLARTIYQPIRYATRESLLAAAQEGLRVTRKIGLLGASLSGYPRLSELVAELVGAGADVSLSSLRADRITPELLSALRRGGQETVTIAPEAGTETLRAAVGKPIPNAALEAAVAAAAEAGLPEVKLYFMTGLPGETPADREAVVELVEGWASRFPTLRFAVTLSPFVPKPWTPLEGEPCPSVREAREIVEGLSAGLRRRTRANVRPGSARLAAVQAALARGDFAVGRALIEAAEQGGGHAALKKALKREGVDLDRPQEAPDEKPWERAIGIAETCGEPGAGGEDRR